MRRYLYGGLLALLLAGVGLIFWLPGSGRGASGPAIETPAPTLTATPAPSPTATATATASPSPTPTLTATPTATPTPVPITSRAIFVDQDAQVMHVYENGVEIRTLPCSTGKPLDWHWTPAWSGRVGYYAGTFYAFGAYYDDAWYLFEGSAGILIHSAPYNIVDGEKVYEDLEDLGVRPGSHGCVRLSPEDARWLTEWDPRGVPMAITPLTRTDH